MLNKTLISTKAIFSKLLFIFLMADTNKLTNKTTVQLFAQLPLLAEGQRCNQGFSGGKSF